MAESSAPTYRRLASLLARRTTDGIVIALILIGLLTLGRHAVFWWNETKIDLAESSANEQLSSLFDGQPFSETLPLVNLESATREQALKKAVELCAQECEKGLSSARRVRRQELLAASEVCGEGNGYRLYATSTGEFLCVYGVATQDENPDSDLATLPLQASVIAIPAAKQQWTLVIVR